MAHGGPKFVERHPGVEGGVGGLAFPRAGPNLMSGGAVVEGGPRSFSHASPNFKNHGPDFPNGSGPGFRNGHGGRGFPPNGSPDFPNGSGPRFHTGSPAHFRNGHGRRGFPPNGSPDFPNGSGPPGYPNGSGPVLEGDGPPRFEGRPAPVDPSVSNVIMVYAEETGKWNCKKLFNLLCLYGNVLRVGFFLQFFFEVVSGVIYSDPARGQNFI